MEQIGEDEFIKVTGLSKDPNTVYAQGLYEPSSETRIHWLIYQSRPEIKVIFHLHDFEVLKKAKKLNLAVTEKEQPYGSVQLIKEVVKILGKNNYLVMKNHGIIALGKDFEEVGKLVLKMHERACKNV